MEPLSEQALARATTAVRDMGVAIEQAATAIAAALVPVTQALAQSAPLIGQAMLPVMRAKYTAAGAPYGPDDADMWRWFLDQPAAAPERAEAE